MPRKKQLKCSGGSITNFDVSIERIKSEHTPATIDVIKLTIEVGDDAYAYRIHKDERFPDLSAAKDDIDSALLLAQKEYLKVEISEDAERSYLRFQVQGQSMRQFTGIRN